MIQIENQGAEISATNYFASPLAKAGKYFCSINAGAFRLLVPPQLEAGLKQEIKLARSFEIEKGPLPSAPGSKGITIWFVDGSDSLYALQLDTNSIDRLPLDSDHGKQVVFSIWSQRGTGCVKIFTSPAKFLVG